MEECRSFEVNGIYFILRISDHHGPERHRVQICDEAFSWDAATFYVDDCDDLVEATGKYAGNAISQPAKAMLQQLMDTLDAAQPQNEKAYLN